MTDTPTPDLMGALRASVERTPHGTPPATNPDTELPMPSATPAQLALVDELLVAHGQSTDPANMTRRMLIEGIVRQHGRTLRSCTRELLDRADHHEAEARRRMAEVRDGEPSAAELLPAADEARAARTLRRVFLHGQRA